MTAALYSNGMIDGDGLRAELNSINERHASMRRAILGVEEEVLEEYVADPDFLKGATSPGA